MKRIVLLLVAAMSVVVLAGCGAAETGGRISPDDYVNNYRDADTEHILLDTRTAEEFAGNHIAGAINIPVQELQSRLSELPNNTPIVVYCRSGNRSAQAATILTEAGYGEVYDLGGITRWTQAGYELQS